MPIIILARNFDTSDYEFMYNIVYCCYSLFYLQEMYTEFVLQQKIQIILYPNKSKAVNPLHIHINTTC